MLPNLRRPIQGKPEPLYEKMKKSGWMLLCHGVAELNDSARRRYRAGVMILDERQPHLIRYRSPEPILSPEKEEEKHGTVNNVVFPTGLDQRADLGQPERFDVYYGMADSRIGVARLTVPEELPLTGNADAHDVM